MAKAAASLSSDLNLIKEFEELRLKQKLLIEALKKKENSKTDKTLQEISSKLDVLVKIFKDANEDTSHEKFLEEKFTQLSQRLDKFEESISQKLESVSQKLDSIESESKKRQIITESRPVKTMANEKVGSEISSIKLDASTSVSEIKTQVEAPPAPDFSTKNDEDKKSKRKWF